ncbi:DUF3016 domain-containing protein [Marinobacterium rhizophilum]|uniref:DUF3016 domain-containing protein n=1 Tax=Marinobacterium rhizophilum TaxID=420402 RepID=A0ABY5HE28_9GAMM|nr:DUF3016 domain-containing protein [Marinobacterium rhizophilum]UTW10214.1 DUF3016 domain-containing protein [Marinobacterium rhizophilum]
MHRTLSRCHLLLALTLSILALSSRANVEIEFVDPRQYTDIGEYGGTYASPGPLPVFERHLQQLGQRCLNAGDNLRIRILDIDLAGRLEWWHSSGYSVIRVMRAVTWPRMTLEYRLLDSNGRLKQQAEESLSDMNYLLRNRLRTISRESYGYDKTMLSRWFQRHFCT